MAINTPESAAEVISRMQTDVAREVPGSNPRLRNSWLWGIVVGLADRVFEFFFALQQAALQLIPDTATGGWLERWGAIWRQTRTEATPAVGNIVFQCAGFASSILAGATAITSDGKVYSTDSTITPSTKGIFCTLARVGTTVTASCTSDHGLASHIAVTISGATPANYNGVQTITVTAADEFTYQVGGAPSTPPTGAIYATYFTAFGDWSSDEEGVDYNQVADTVITLQTPVAGVTSEGQVDFDAMTGGSDQEGDEALRTRALYAIQNPVANFNVAKITQVAMAIAGVTRVWVREATPVTGQVTVHFMRDNDANPIPSGAAITAVDDAIQEIRPANTIESDVIISAPIAVTSVYTFTALLPNTLTMQAAITASLQQFYAEDTNVDDGVSLDGDVLEVAYTSAIYNTVDPVTGERVVSFTLSAPPGDVSVGAGYIGTLGAITYP